MSCTIEDSLIKRFSGFSEALLHGDLDSIQRFACVDERMFDAPEPRVDALQHMMSLRLDTLAAVRQSLRAMADVLPAPYWCPVILAFSNARDREKMREQLVAAGVPVDSPGRGRYLRHVNMLRVPVPPIRSTLDWLGTLEGVVLLGDGSRRIAMPPAPGMDAQMTAGPWQALRMLMMGSGQMPIDIAQLKRSVRVAVIDTGIDTEHPAFEGVVEKRIDLAGTGLGPVDPDGHGTHVAGTIAGKAPEGRLELSGIAPFASLVDLQIWTPLGLALDVLLDAVGAAIEERVDVLNMSLGGHEATTGKSILSLAIQSAAEHGIVCCAAAGNDGDNEYRRISTPGDAPAAIMVAATTLDGKRAEFSSMGPSDSPEYTGHKPNVAAPGCGIISARSQFSMARGVDPNGRYAVMHGTSVASPMVAGISALGVAVLHAAGKTINGIDGIRRFCSALTASCRDAFSEGVNSVGAGIPQVPAFLGNLVCLFDDLTKRVFVIHRPTPPSAQPEPAPSGLTESMSINAEQKHSAAGLSPKEEAYSPDWGRCRDIEQHFIIAVRSNIGLHAQDMVRELTGAESLPISDDAMELRNEAMVIRAEAIRAGIDVKDRRLPDNSELWITASGRGFMSTKPVFYIGVKSIAAWTIFEDLGKMTGGQIAQRVSDYVTRQQKEAGDTPCAFVLFSPKPWDPEVLTRSHSGQRHRLFWCSRVDGDWRGLWFSLENHDVGWHTWKAFTPMTDHFRVQWCRERLLEQTELLLPGGVMALGDLAESLGLSERVVEGLVKEIEKQDRRQFLLEYGSSGKKYVQRAGV